MVCSRGNFFLKRLTSSIRMEESTWRFNAPVRRSRADAATPSIGTTKLTNSTPPPVALRKGLTPSRSYSTLPLVRTSPAVAAANEAADGQNRLRRPARLKAESCSGSF
eukprot:GHVT01045332.1.p1 GENE.GHVT01045332.1~~GHVT01045332.1.p1  ORF type:complete len:108 (-),score=27.29 GHVT01045332.1:414-737(-)